MDDSKKQNTNNETDTLKCPLNKFQPCIGSECAFSFDRHTLTIPRQEEDNDAVTGEFSSLIPCHPCAITITGLSTVFNLLGFSLLPKDD